MKILSQTISFFGKIAADKVDEVGKTKQENIEHSLLNASLQKKFYGVALAVAAIGLAILFSPLLAKGTIAGAILGIPIFAINATLLVLAYDMAKFGMNIASFACDKKKKAECFIRTKEGFYEKASQEQHENSLNHQRWVYYTKGTLFLPHIMQHYHLVKETERGSSHPIGRPQFTNPQEFEQYVRQHAADLGYDPSQLSFVRTNNNNAED